MLDDLTSIYDVIAWNKGSKEEHSGGGIFITLPTKLAKKFPTDGKAGEDDSPAHVTVLYVDDVKEKVSKKGKYLKAIEDVCKKTKPFKVTLGSTKSFPGEGEKKVYYASVDCKELHKFNAALKSKFETDKLSYSKKHKGFTPHVTIEYADSEEKSKHKNKTMKGEWEVRHVWLWGFGEPSAIFLGG